MRFLRPAVRRLPGKGMDAHFLFGPGGDKTMNKLETREQFEARYTAESSGVVFGDNMVSMPCTCDDGVGPTHWAAIRNTPEAIQSHLDHEACLNDIRKE